MDDLKFCSDDALYIKSFTPACNIVFCDGGKEIGRLDWGDGSLRFEGEIGETAQRFFEFLKPYVDEYIRNRSN